MRQYNGQKPTKFRIDFFVLCCASLYCIHHMDVYQGKNAPNVGIDSTIHNVKTTMKAVLNAVIYCRLDETTQGARHITMDNRYQCPQLAVVLREQYNVLSTGTARKNRTGWDKTLMGLLKSDAKGKSVFAYDKVNRVLCCQWNDSKVVNIVSTVVDTSLTTVYRQKGKERLEFPCPTVLRKYHKTMFGVDKHQRKKFLTIMAHDT